MRFILASSSPRRRELISTLGIPFEIIKPDIDETQHPDENPFDYVRRLSIEKAQAVVDQIEGNATVLAADTIVVLAADTIGVAEDGELLGKPANANEARAMLRRLRARSHIVCTAFTLQQVNGVIITELVKTIVHMRDYSDAEIEAYIATGDPFDKAGSYAIQHEGFAPVARIEGDRNNVIGLPLDAVKAALAKLSSH
ncbi:MAG: septum formation protein Maf [Phototrophicales bacterium]|nr:MAG: septum formation protein Maf [Phototrophicales bacterium]RMG74870.1 MAG: septum formation protein Maf [Chloroflexota bacterium]